MKQRKVIELKEAHATSDGAGVNINRVFGGPNLERFDPFLMFDDFGSDDPDDYIAGFPPHPHRGFETVTYMLEGKMEHQDHLGNVGLLSDGGVQWMTAGEGIIHSEMPKQTEGRMHGFQLWVNLPAAKKMQPARYEDVPAADISHYSLYGVSAKAIAGNLEVNGATLKGYFDVADTEVNYVDFDLAANVSLNIKVPNSHTVLVYVFAGSIQAPEFIKSGQLARFDQGEHLVIENTSEQNARFIFISGKPLGEPIKQHGPFVMNTEEEIEQAIQDYRNGVIQNGGRAEG